MFEVNHSHYSLDAQLALRGPTEYSTGVVLPTGLTSRQWYMPKAAVALRPWELAVTCGLVI